MQNSKKNKVLLLSSWYPTKVKPTLGNFVQRHAAAIALYADITVLHVSFNPNQTKEIEISRFEDEGIKTIIYYVKKKSGLPIIAQFRQFKQYISLYQEAIRTEFPNFSFDIIHANVIFPIAAVAKKIADKYNVPYIITEHSTKYLSKISFLHKRFIKLYTDETSVFTPVTHNLANGMRRNGIEGEMIRINNVVDTSIFFLKEPKTDNKFRFVHISTLVDKHKNIRGILNVCKKLSQQHSNFELHIITDGNEAPYKKWAEENKLKDTTILFHGEKTINQIADFIPSCDALLLFSNYENFPCVIVEALAAGLPVLSTDVGGIKEHLTKDLGVLIPKNNEKALLVEMEKFIVGKYQFNHESLRNYAIKNFSYEAVGKEFIDLYNNQLKNKENC